jgi:hypothetical protein
LGVTVLDETTGQTQLAREFPGGREAFTGLEPPGADRVPQLSLHLRGQPLRAVPVDGQKQPW